MRDMYSRRFRMWLRNMHLHDDPFALYEAGREVEKAERGVPILSLFFVDRPYLYKVLGDPATPQAAFLLADRGCGKTATRAMVGYEGQHGKLRQRVLVVPYTDFDSLLNKVDRRIELLSSRHHLSTVLRYALKAAAGDASPDRWAALQGADRRLLKGYVQEFADPKTQIQWSALLEDPAEPLDWDRLSSRETLEIFADLVVQMGYRAIYVLVDRVDEFPETAGDVAKAVALLRPLVADQPLLEMKHVAFKFFLPTQVGEALREAVTVRTDRVPWQKVTWDRESLERMVQLRLQHYSSDYVLSLEDLCVPEARYVAMHRLIDASEGSPRTLLRLCGKLIHHHVTHSDSPLITRSDVTETLHEFQPTLEAERKNRYENPANAPTSASSPPAEGLHLDDHGRVWVDSAELEEQPTQLEFRLLETLYKHNGAIVSNEELIRDVWGDSYPDQDETNLRKLISRLRKKLEPHSFGNSSSFIQNVHGRGYALRG